MIFPFNRPERTARLPHQQRLLILFVAAVLLVLSFPPAHAAADEHRDQPTIVLVHGAWAGPSSWNQVVRNLHDDGYRTATPALGLQTLQADVVTVRAALDTIPGKKILVAHSYGGAVISNAAYGRSDILGLVYAAAFVPDQGDTLVSLGTGFAPSDVVNHFRWTGPPFAPGSLSTIDPAFFPQLFAQDLPVRQAAALNAAQQPTAFIPLFVTPSGPVAWHTLPSWYAVSGADRMIDPADERFMAERADATTIEFPTASHVGGITVHAGRFTGLIEQSQGRPEPFLDLWSHADDVTIMAAVGGYRIGFEQVSNLLRWASKAQKFDNWSAENIVTIVLSDLAFSVELETYGQQGEGKGMTLRATQVYRREDGEWKVIHRHGDVLTPVEVKW